MNDHHPNHSSPAELMTDRISSLSLSDLLGTPLSTPLDTESMAASLRVACMHAPGLSPRLERFTKVLLESLAECGVTIVSGFGNATETGRIEAGTTLLAPGSFPDDHLPIGRVSTLYNNLIVGIYDEPHPVTSGATPQEILDAVVARLAWEMVHLIIYVTASSWTVCSMNGGVTTFPTTLPEPGDVLASLVPKLTAQVVPPKAGELELRPGKLDTSEQGFRVIAEDFIRSGLLWSRNARLLSHTSRETLAYRNPYCRKIVARYLDDRSGMSYGFFARQHPVNPPPAILVNQNVPDDNPVGSPSNHDGLMVISVSIAGVQLLVPVPEVSVITTRSGCRKTAIDPARDLVEIGLKKGRIWLATPAGLPPEFVTRPSFDTLTIVAHAAGNAMISSILQTLLPGSSFPAYLATSGASMTHWHDYPDPSLLPDGFVVHGEEKPPVSCSTPQSAAYSLLGKLEALEQSLENGIEYLGDLHIEPGHGCNLVGAMSLTEAARMMNGEEGE